MKLGQIGLGAMGAGIARNLRKMQEDLLVYARSEETRGAFRREGFSVAESLRDFAACDLVFLSLPDTQTVETVLLGEDGLARQLKKDAVVADLSTISCKAAVRLQQELAALGIDFLDAPVSGMQQRAENGTLTVMCGGEKPVFDAAKPYFRAFGTKILYMGKSGCGQLTKLVNQALFDINAAGMAEILPLAVRLGLDPEKIGEVVNSGTGRSYASEQFIPHILEGEFHRAYPIGSAYKDLVSAAELEAEQNLALPVLDAAATVFRRALEEGFGDCDKGGLIQVYEKELGAEFRKRKKRV